MVRWLQLKKLKQWWNRDENLKRDDQIEIKWEIK